MFIIVSKKFQAINKKYNKWLTSKFFPGAQNVFNIWKSNCLTATGHHTNL